MKGHGQYAHVMEGLEVCCVGVVDGGIVLVVYYECLQISMNGLYFQYVNFRALLKVQSGQPDIVKNTS